MKRVLFIGNSYTGYNDLPQLVRSLAEETGCSLETEAITRGGAQLKWHLSVASTAERIKEGSWDYVVLQDQSLQAVQRPRAMHTAIDGFAELIRDANALPVLYMTWARQHQPEIQEVITREYTLAAQRTASVLAPVGEAWRAAFEQNPDLVLHDKDESHPNLLGSYLAACVITAVLTNTAPTTLPKSVPGGETTERFASELIALLQRAAEQAVSNQLPRHPARTSD